MDFYNDLMKNIQTMKIMEEKNIGNENVVKYYEYFDNKEEFAIVIELCDYSFLNYFIRNKMSFNINEIYDLLLQLNNTFKIIIENKIYHGNINLDNIFIKEDTNKKLIYKLSNNYYLGERYIDLFCDNINYMAPEIIEAGKYDGRSDLWSLGVLIYCLFFKKFPFRGRNMLVILNDIKHGKELAKTGNDNLDDLISRLLIEEKKKE